MWDRDMSMGEQNKREKHRKHWALSVCQSQLAVVKTVYCLIDCYLH